MQLTSSQMISLSLLHTHLKYQSKPPKSRVRDSLGEIQCQNNRQRETKFEEPRNSFRKEPM